MNKIIINMENGDFAQLQRQTFEADRYLDGDMFQTSGHGVERAFKEECATLASDCEPRRPRAK